MVPATNLPTRAVAPGAIRCHGCDASLDARWRFCPHCGDAAPATGAAVPIGSATASDTDYHPLPGLTDASAAAKRRRRRQRRPLYRRPKVVLPALVILLVLGGAGYGLYQATSVMTSLRTISTPPPQIIDSTYMDDDDPALAGGPITVDTGPAQRALAASDQTLSSQPQADGLGGQLQSFRSDVGDVVNAASVAAGMEEGRAEGFTMLVMGVDARPGAAIDIGVRPDVLMLVRFDAELRTCRMLSIPRDTRVELPGYGKTKINHALMVGGIPYQVMVTEEFIDQPIDHYLLVDFVAFQQVVEALGGIQVTIPEDLEKQDEIRYREGTYNFDGEEALAYARFRTFSDDGDLSRVERQWSILASMARAAGGRDLIGDVNSLVPTIEDHLRTDLTLTEMTAIARNYGPACLSADRDAVAKVEGSRVRFADPILDKVDYYNVVSEVTVTERVDALLGLAPETGTATEPSSSGEQRGHNWERWCRWCGSATRSSLGLGPREADSVILYGHFRSNGDGWTTRQWFRAATEGQHR